MFDLFEMKEAIVNVFCDHASVYFTMIGVIVSFYIALRFIIIIAGEAIVLVLGGWLATDLAKEGSWAVVTGATDGIGKAYCQELAKRGLNVVLIARSQEKLANVSREIELSTSVETICITVDFSHGPDIYDLIEDRLKDLDVGVLVNNVGMPPPVPDVFLGYDKQLCLDIVAVTATSTMMMTRIVMPGMVKRKRGHIINISSGVVYLPGTSHSIYTLAKIFTDNLSRILSYEYKGTGVSLQSVTPFFVQTNLIKNYKVKDSYLCPSPLPFVRSQLNTVGLQAKTCGWIWHTLQMYVCIMMPSRFMDWFNFTMFQRARRSMLAKQK